MDYRRFLFQSGHLVLPHMNDDDWGRIVNVSSSSTHGGQSMISHYVASKSGMVGLTKSLALEFGPQGLTVNTIPPGFIDTPMTRRSEAKGLLRDSIEHHDTRTPVRPAGRPDDIPATSSSIGAEGAGAITGKVNSVQAVEETE